MRTKIEREIYCDHCGYQITKGSYYWYGKWESIVCSECEKDFLRFDKRVKKYIDISDCCYDRHGIPETFKMHIY